MLPFHKGATKIYCRKVKTYSGMFVFCFFKELDVLSSVSRADIGSYNNENFKKLINKETTHSQHRNTLKPQDLWVLHLTKQ